jgi:hypothetical protein
MSAAFGRPLLAWSELHHLAKQTTATLAAVRKQAVDWARLAAPGDVGATPDDTAFAEAGHIILAALGDPQPATEPEAEHEHGWAPATCHRMDTRTTKEN